MAEQTPSIDPYSPAELINWYHDVGVDIALSDTPVDQFAAFKQEVEARKTKAATPRTERKLPERASLTPAKSPAPRQMQDAAIPDGSAIEDARAQAQAANSLEELQAVVANFKGCNLRLGAKNAVFGEGNSKSGIMLVGEVPDRDEDTNGLPFIGRPGLLLEKMLAAIQLDREQVYMTNIIPWRPPGGRKTTPPETEICRPFIERQIELVAPKVLILFGETPSRFLLNSKDGFVKIRGQWKKISIGGQEIDTLATLHPTRLLQQSAQKKLAWQDLLNIKAKLAELNLYPDA